MTNYYDKKIATFYKKKQVCFDKMDDSRSQSPLKPYLLMKRIKEFNPSLLEVFGDFQPISRKDLAIAHTPKYIDDVMDRNISTSGIPASKNLSESLLYTSSSLFHAIEYACKNPSKITLAPVSGMHHAKPNSGVGFCTFSGQVISSIKMYEEYGLVGSYVDLDEHFGNSIENARDFNSKVNKAIPRGCNINISSKDDKAYVKMLKKELSDLGKLIMKDKVHYVVFCHGADSHRDDDMSGRLSTEYWIKCADIFSRWILDLNSKRKTKMPVILTLFGGYRDDDYNSVLDLHRNSIITVSNVLSGTSFTKVDIEPRPRRITSLQEFYESRESEVYVPHYKDIDLHGDNKRTRRNRRNNKLKSKLC